MMQEHQWLDSDPGLKTGVRCSRIFLGYRMISQDGKIPGLLSLSHLPAKDTARGTRNRLSLEDTDRDFV